MQCASNGRFYFLIDSSVFLRAAFHRSIENWAKEEEEEGEGDEQEKEAENISQRLADDVMTIH